MYARRAAHNLIPRKQIPKFTVCCTLYLLQSLQSVFAEPFAAAGFSAAGREQPEDRIYVVLSIAEILATS